MRVVVSAHADRVAVIDAACLRWTWSAESEMDSDAFPEVAGGSWWVVVGSMSVVVFGLAGCGGTKASWVVAGGRWGWCAFGPMAGQV